MEKTTHVGQNFSFHILEEKNTISIGLASSYVYAPVDKNELKELAQFILQYLENN